MQFVRYSRLRAAKGFGMGLAIHDRVCPPPSLPFHPLSPSTRNKICPHTNKPLGTHPKPHPTSFLPFPFPSLPFVPHHSMPSTTSPPAPATVIKPNQTKSNHQPQNQPRQLSEPPPIYPADPSPIQPRRNLYPTLPPTPPPPNPETPPVILHPSVPTSTTEPPLPSRARDPTARR